MAGSGEVRHLSLRYHGDMTIPPTVKRQVDAINRHDPAALAAEYAPDAVVADPAYPEPLRGPSAVEKDMVDFLRAFPDLRVQPQRPIVEGPACAYELVMEGTHNGPLSGPAGELPATGRRLKLTTSVHARVGADQRIVDERRFYDFASLLTQLGLLR